MNLPCFCTGRLALVTLPLFWSLLDSLWKHLATNRTALGPALSSPAWLLWLLLPGDTEVVGLLSYGVSFQEPAWLWDCGTFYHVKHVSIDSHLPEHLCCCCFNQELALGSVEVTHQAWRFMHGCLQTGRPWKHRVRSRENPCICFTCSAASETWPIVDQELSVQDLGWLAERKKTLKEQRPHVQSGPCPRQPDSPRWEGPSCCENFSRGEGAVCAKPSALSDPGPRPAPVCPVSLGQLVALMAQG